MKTYCQFKKSSMLSPIIVVFFLLISFGISQAFDLDVWFDNRINQYYKKNDGYYFILDLRPDSTGELDAVDYVTAVNTAPDLYNDYETYFFEVIFFGNNILEIVSKNEYKGQGGSYEVTLHFNDDESTTTATTGHIDPRMDPIPNPENLKVDFSSGFLNPTMSFSSVEDETVDSYELALYIEPYRQRRLARYNTEDPDYESFTYYEGDQGGTGEALEVGKVYIFRAEAYDFGTGGDGFYRSFNYLAFLVPDPDIHYTCEYLRTTIEESEIPIGIQLSLLAKLRECDENKLKAFINQVSALRGVKIYRWLSDVLIQCANGVLETR